MFEELDLKIGEKRKPEVCFPPPEGCPTVTCAAACKTLTCKAPCK